MGLKGLNLYIYKYPNLVRTCIFITTLKMLRKFKGVFEN